MNRIQTNDRYILRKVGILMVLLAFISVAITSCDRTKLQIPEEPNPNKPVVYCQVGDVLGPGDSCLDGTGDTFRVLENGRVHYISSTMGSFTAGGDIALRGKFNGKFHNFIAEKQDDGTYIIKAVTPKK